MKKLCCVLTVLLVLALSVGCAEAVGQEYAKSDASAMTDAVIEETVLYERGGIKLTAKDFDPKAVFGPEIKLLVENGSDSAINISARNCSVNGYMIEGLMSEGLAPGKKANTTLTLLRSDLERAGICSIAEIEFSLHIYDPDTWTITDTEPILITTSAAENYEPEFDNSGNMILNTKDIEVVVRGLDPNDSFLGPGILVYIANHTGRFVTVSTRDVSVNGFMVDAFFACELSPGKHAIDSITFMASELKENDISDIEEVELSLHIYDASDWQTVLDSDPITLEFTK